MVSDIKSNRKTLPIMCSNGPLPGSLNSFSRIAFSPSNDTEVAAPATVVSFAILPFVNESKSSFAA